MTNDLNEKEKAYVDAMWKRGVMMIVIPASVIGAIIFFSFFWK
jgi:hypothetical protein